VAEEILAPLGMSRSSFRQPLPDALSPDLAVGYGNRLEAFAFEWLQPSPAGALSTTATDMARFVIAHLGRGHHGNTHILAPATAEAMERRQFGNDPRAAGLTYGF
jgi:CubicO group peptidase (beta-lactamase class C family)